MADGEVASILAGVGGKTDEMEEEEDRAEEDEEEGDGEEEPAETLYNSSTTADDGTIAELTMP